MKHIYIFLSLFLVASFLPTRVFAQTINTPLDLTAYPSTFTLTIKPGESTHQQFRIRNNTDTTLPLSVSIKKLIPDTKGSVTITDFTKNDTYAQWISFDKTTLSALPREWTDVNFTIKVPKESAFGYYYVIYIAPIETTTSPTQTHTTLTGSLAIPILLTVDKPGATINGDMSSFISLLTLSEYLPINFLTTFRNTGNLHIRPTGNIFIKDWTGKTVDILTINSTGGVILPGGTRSYTTPWDNSFITNDPIMVDNTIQRDSNGNVKTHLVFHFDRVLQLRIGKYTAIALSVIPTQSRDLSFQSSTTFWVFPWKVVGLLVLVVLFAGIGLVNTGKSIIRGVRRLWKK